MNPLSVIVILYNAMSCCQAKATVFLLIFRRKTHQQMSPKWQITQRHAIPVSPGHRRGSQNLMIVLIQGRVDFLCSVLSLTVSFRLRVLFQAVFTHRRMFKRDCAIRSPRAGMSSSTVACCSNGKEPRCPCHSADSLCALSALLVWFCTL